MLRGGGRCRCDLRHGAESGNPLAVMQVTPAWSAGGRGGAQGFRNSTMRLEFVPRWLFLTPQILAVLVKRWVLMRIAEHSKPADAPIGATTSSSLTVPRRTSPTSNATHPPG